MSEPIKIGDVVQIDSQVVSCPYLAIVTGFDDDLLILHRPGDTMLHYMHRNWCYRIGRALWGPTSSRIHLPALQRLPAPPQTEP